MPSPSDASLASSVVTLLRHMPRHVAPPAIASAASTSCSGIHDPAMERVWERAPLMEAAIKEHIELLQCKIADLHDSLNQLLIVSDESQHSEVQALWSTIVQMETLVAERKTAHLARLREYNRCVQAMDSWRRYCEGREWSYPRFSVRVSRPWPVLKRYVRPQLMISEFAYTSQPELNSMSPPFVYSRVEGMSYFLRCVLPYGTRATSRFLSVLRSAALATARGTLRVVLGSTSGSHVLLGSTSGSRSRIRPPG